MVDVCVGTVTWCFLGSGIADGLPEEPSHFVGTNSFLGGGFPDADAEGHAGEAVGGHVRFIFK